jgi:hypothetical protein
MKRSLVVALAFFIAGCAGSHVSVTGTSARISGPINTIALMPGGGILADAIGVELSNHGFNVIESSAMTALMARLNLDEFELTQPQSLEKLKEKNIDAYLSVKAAAGNDRRPQSASVRLNSTTDGRILAGVSWQNGWGGMEGSMADRTMRKDVAGAAKEITQSLIRRIRQR